MDFQRFIPHTNRQLGSARLSSALRPVCVCLLLAFQNTKAENRQVIESEPYAAAGYCCAVAVTVTFFTSLYLSCLVDIAFSSLERFNNDRLSFQKQFVSRLISFCVSFALLFGAKGKSENVKRLWFLCKQQRFCRQIGGLPSPLHTHSLSLPLALAPCRPLSLDWCCLKSIVKLENRNLFIDVTKKLT